MAAKAKAPLKNAGLFIARCFTFASFCLITIRYNGYNASPEIF